MWTPLLPRDNKEMAVEATTYLSDLRAEHFWDLWSFGLKAYTRKLGYPSGETAWDIYIFFKPHVVWKGQPPAPTFWMQNRGVKGLPDFSADKFEAEVLKWVR